MYEGNKSCPSGVNINEIRKRLERTEFCDTTSVRNPSADECASKAIPTLTAHLDCTSSEVVAGMNENAPPRFETGDATCSSHVNKSFESSVSTESDYVNWSAISARSSFLNNEQCTVDKEQSGSKTPTSVKSTIAHFDNLISSGQIRAPGATSRDSYSSSTIVSPQENNLVGRPSSEASWSDLRYDASSMSSDTETNSYNDLSDLQDEETLLERDTSFEDANSFRPIRKSPIFGSNQYESAIEELRSSEMFQKNELRKSDSPQMRGKTLSVGRLVSSRPHLPRKNREVKSQPLTAEDVDNVVKIRHKSDATDKIVPQSSSGDGFDSRRMSTISSISDVTTDHRLSDTIVYSTGDRAEDIRLKKLHYAAYEIYTVEKKFVEQLDILAVQYPKFLSEYGKSYGVDLLNDQAKVISSISTQLQMLKGAHSVLLEKFSTKLSNWDSRRPDLAEVLKNNAAFLKFCLPYLLQKKKFADDLKNLLQANEILAQATSKFEAETSHQISIIQRLDIVHQNVVRYNILLEAYRKYLIPDSHEFNECQCAIKELAKVSEVVNERMSHAIMEERLVQLYRRLESRFNVFEANRHLLHEGELMKQSRKDIQPRYLILFSDVLLICKYSRTPTLGSEVGFQADFYQFPILSVRVKAEEHGEYDTHFQLLSTKKSAVFIARNKHERDDWVKRLNNAKREAKRLKRIPVGRNVKAGESLCSEVDSSTSATITPTANKSLDKETSDNEASPTLVTVHEKYVAPWVPDPKATTCMMSGCNTKFSILNRRHHCRECGALICGSCVGYAPVRCAENFIREKVCPECYGKIMNRWCGSFSPSIFSAPSNSCFRSKKKVSDGGQKGIVSGTVFVRNKRFGETQKWGRLFQHADGAMVLCFYNAEFDPEPCARHVLMGFDLTTNQLEEGGVLFELSHSNQVKGGGQALSIAFRVAHAGSAEQLVL
ncbi:unnamed protein product [Anisakis simplex]|uniref:DH domain-containing protein n=1 Tax=Anisakis simplex TaxID=6269 RepID=A0A0M3JU75_ANISI|nr:unnamed protein product [Anisakis simplex]